jgi:multisubunit Na+/H+ antiporter MnhC subunit
MLFNAQGSVGLCVTGETLVKPLLLVMVLTAITIASNEA